MVKTVNEVAQGIQVLKMYPLGVLVLKQSWCYNIILMCARICVTFCTTLFITHYKEHCFELSILSLWA